MSEDQGSARRQGFHSIKVTGDREGNILTTVEMSNVVELRPGQDVTRDPKFLGESPKRLGNGGCSRCKGRYHGHVLNGVDVSARAFHRFDVAGGGYFDDELAQGQR